MAREPARRVGHIFDFMTWPFEEEGGWPGWWRGLSRSPMRVEVYMEGDTFVVRAELPGVDPDKDVEVSVDDGVLTISAERQEEKREERAGGYRSEFYYGTLRRTVPLPRGADESKLSAMYKDGVLQVTVPCPTAEQPAGRKVNISRG